MYLSLRTHHINNGSVQLTEERGVEKLRGRDWRSVYLSTKLTADESDRNEGECKLPS